MIKPRNAALFLAILLCLLAGGCGGGGKSPAPASPTISTQPSSQVVEVGGMGTFSVVAQGTPPLTYQWLWDGMAINNTNEASLTLPASVPSDNQSTLSVIVTNSQGSVTSEAAVLTVNGGPRPPIQGDLRFHDVDAFPLGIQWALQTNVEALGTISFTDAVGSPLQIGWPGPSEPTGQQDDSWFFLEGPLPLGAPGRTTKYVTGILANFSTDLASLEDPSSVIASLDFDTGENCYGAELVKTSGGNGGYASNSQTLASSDLPTAAAQEAAQGRVITALSLNGGQVTYLSYGWQGDPSTVYETNVANATLATLVATATGLAQNGYIITGCGGSDQVGFILVGTRVKGDLTPRPLNHPIPSPYSRGYSPVINVFSYDPNNPDNDSYIMISEM